MPGGAELRHTYPAFLTGFRREAGEEAVYARLATEVPGLRLRFQPVGLTGRRVGAYGSERNVLGKYSEETERVRRPAGSRDSLIR
jgi:hypothetical protein